MIDLLLLLGVGEAIAGVENAHVVRVLDVALLEVQFHRKLVAKIMEGVEGFGLRLGNWRDFLTSREGTIPDKVSTSVLNGQAFGSRRGGRLVVNQGSRRKRLFGPAEAEAKLLSIATFWIGRDESGDRSEDLHFKMPILGEGVNKVWTRAGDLVVDSGDARQFARATLGSSLQRKK